ncbi:DNA polymerase III subunit beta [Coxiella endosymbiont of Amblyomma nuttalli]|uniref:DNA polymerase III subunit beta n=1 Tax=Coxiella endosymbiont of Amblyomma nuttalli TaxID=2749996 RepID=UPI001BAB328E|nr:DNA polymerase III subunit beta [Coxiella endosymbiont of Amblyomma nuttalli]QTS83553.1 DNA polymerase III subunit beta [Coxiella endosymbiont of Amblyomma nuttalli]
MKLNLIRETLLRPLQLVIGVVERKQTIPILSNVLLSTEKNTLSITGTDLEVELIGQIQLEKDDEVDQLKLTIPGRKLMDVCRALPKNALIELYRDKGKIILRSGFSRFTLSTLPAEDFPSVERRETYLKLMISQHQFHRLLQRTAFAMAQQDVRYYLNGLLFETYPTQLRAIATDGHRLSANVLNIETNIEHRLQIIIPRKGVIELLRLLADNDDPAMLKIGDNHICVSTKDFTFTSKLIEGRFPDCERVIPKGGNKQVVIDRNILKQALIRTAVLCNEKFKGIRFEFRQNLLRILATNHQQETAEEKVKIDYAKEDLNIGFNVNYLLDVLNTISSSGNITLTFSNPDSSVLIQESENQTDSAFVVMPMRL